MEPIRRTLRVDEVAAQLGVSTTLVRRAIARGELEARHLGDVVLVPVSALERLVGGRDLPEPRR
jgi:excisionase family DNA binding protein